jgi:hypothetical protein
MTSVFGLHFVGYMATVHDDVASITNPQFDVANLRVRSGKLHLKFVSRNITDVGLAWVLFDQD